MNKLKKALGDPRSFLFLAPLILFAPVYLTGRSLYWGTVSTQFIPWWEFAWESILSGQLPLWNPLVGMGAPLAANYQAALFYPPTWIYFIFYLLGGTTWMAWAVSLVVSGHLIWSGVGTASLLRKLGINEFGQTIGGLAFSLSGYLVARAGFLSINAAVAWIPWLMLCLYCLADSNKKKLVKLTAVISMILLAGHAQTAWIALMLGSFWVIFWGFIKGKERKSFNLGRALAGYCGAGLLAIAISAVQLIPTAEYLYNSQRSVEYGFETAMTYSFWPWRFLTLIVPDLFGNPGTSNYWGYGNYWEDAVYLGLLPILLAAGYLIKSIRKREDQNDENKQADNPALDIFLGGVVIFSFVLALGSNTPVFPFLYKNIIGFGLFQAPSRYSIMAVFALAVLAGLGADGMVKPTGRKIYFARLAAAGCVSIVLGTFGAGALLPDIKLSFLLSVGKAGLIGLFITAAYLLMPDRKDKKALKIWIIVAVCLVSIDMVSTGWRLNPSIEREFYEFDNPVEADGRIWMPSEVEYELKFNKFFGFNSFSTDTDWEDMHRVHIPNIAMLQESRMVNNFDPIVPGYYQDWMDGINSKKPNDQVLELMNIGTVIELSETDVAELVPLDLEIKPVRVAGCAGVLSLDEQDPGLILNSETNLLKEILVTSEIPVPCDPVVEGKVEVTEERNGHIKLDIEMDQDGWVLWSQSWYPGWIYRIDESRGEDSFRVNYLFQGAPVPAGTEKVEFVYKPLSFIWGSVISAASLLFGGIYFAAKKRKMLK